MSVNTDPPSYFALPSDDNVIPLRRLSGSNNSIHNVNPINPYAFSPVSSARSNSSFNNNPNDDNVYYASPKSCRSCLCQTCCICAYDPDLQDDDNNNDYHEFHSSHANINPLDLHVQSAKTVQFNACGCKRTNRCWCCPRLHKPSRLTVSIIVVVSIIALLLLSHFVVLPWLLKLIINHSTLDFNSVVISQPGDTSFTLTSAGTIGGTGPFSADLAALPLKIYFANQLLGVVHMPGLTVNGETDFSIVNRFQVENMQAFNTFTHSIIFDDQVYWHLSGMGSITPRIFGLRTITYDNVPFEKTISLRGCNGLKDVTLQVFNLNDSTSTQIIAQAAVQINNPSIFSIQPMGNLRFNVMYQNTFMATLISNNSYLYPGQNSISMVGALQPADQNTVDDLINRYLTAQDVLIVAQADKNVSSFPLFNVGMQGLSLPVTLKGRDLGIIRSVDFPSMELTPVDLLHVRLVASSFISINSPLGPNAPLSMRWAQMSLDASFNGVVIASMVTDRMNVTQVASDKFQILVDTVMDVTGNGDLFANFVTNFVQSNTTLYMGLSGRANLLADFCLGLVPISGMAIHNQVPLKGMGGLSNMTLQGFDVPSNSPIKGLEVVSNISLYNPSVAEIKLDQADFTMEFGNVSMGLLSAYQITIAPGTNMLKSKGYMFPSFIFPSAPSPARRPEHQVEAIADGPSALDIASEFISKYLVGIPQLLQVRGVSAGTTPVTWLQNAIRSINVPFVFSGSPVQFLSDISLQSLSVYDNNGVPMAAANVLAKLHLPWEAPFLVTGIESLLLQMCFSDTCSDKFASLIIPGVSINVVHNLATSVLNITTTYQPTIISQTALSLFELYVSNMLMSNTVKVFFSGVANPYVSTAMGLLDLKNIPSSSWLDMTAFSGFVGGMLVTNTDVVAGGPNTLNMIVDFTLTNPTVIEVNVGSLSMEMWAQGSTPGVYDVYLGNCTVNNFMLRRGVNALTAVGVYHTPQNNPQVGVQLMSNFCNQITNQIQVRGTRFSTSIWYMQNAMASYANFVNVPGLKNKLVQKFDVVLSKTFFTIFPTRGTIVNPFTSGWEILSANCTVQTSTGKNIGYWQMLPTDTPIVVPPKGSVVTSPLNVVVTNPTLDFLIEVVSILNKDGTMNVFGELTTRIGNGFVITFPWTGNAVPTTISWS